MKLVVIALLLLLSACATTRSPAIWRTPPLNAIQLAGQAELIRLRELSSRSNDVTVTIIVKAQ